MEEVALIIDTIGFVYTLLVGALFSVVVIIGFIAVLVVIFSNKKD
jgi:hypothetical protein